MVARMRNLRDLKDLTIRQLINRVANIEGVTVEAVPSSFIESGAILQVDADLEQFIYTLVL